MVVSLAKAYLILLAVLSVGAGLVPRMATAAEPLHGRIDALVAAGLPEALASSVCSDEAFVRRIYLDLHGTVPSPEQVRSYLEDPAADKRERLVDQLLAAPRYARHMASSLDVMLMERRGEKHVKSAEWEAYLLASVRGDKPLDVLCREILAADGQDEANRAAARFYLDREAETDLLTRDVGRIFFGQDLQCAQCHDHPVIFDYYQRDYHGLRALLLRSYLFTDKKAKKTFLAEKAEGEAAFQSVFVESNKGTAEPRLPGGKPLAEPTFEKGEAYQVKPSKTAAGKPKFSRRELLATAATDGSNTAFNRNWANRLWRHMLGRGLVEPVDLHHPENPPSHPELLALLSAELRAMDYDVRRFLREIALSKTYQRPFDLPSTVFGHAEQAQAKIAALQEQQQKAESLLPEHEKQAAAAEESLAALQEKVTELRSQLAEARQLLEMAADPAKQAQRALRSAQAQVAALRDIGSVLGSAAAQAQAEVDQLPKEKQLAAAEKKIDAQSAALTADVSAVMAKLKEQQANATITPEEIGTAQQTLAKLAPQLEKTQKAQAAARAQRDAALSSLTAVKQTIRGCQARQQELQLLAAYAQAKATIASPERGQLTAMRAEAQSQLADASTALASLTDQIAAAETKKEAAQQEIKNTAAQVAQAQTAAKALREAASSSRAAVAVLPEDEELSSAAQVLAARAATAEAKLADLEKQHAAAQQMLAATEEQRAERSAEEKRLSASIAQYREQLRSIGGRLAALSQGDANSEQVEAARVALISHWTDRLGLARLKPLSPEALAWSLLTVSGQVSAQETAARAELQKKQPLSDADREVASKVEARARQVESQVYAKLRGQEANFVKLFAAGPGQPQDVFFATVDQALFFANGSQLRSWLSPGGNGLTQRMLEKQSPAAVADELYYTVLSRRPTEAEIEEVSDYLAAAGEAHRADAVQELAWSLVSSAEFRFNH